MKILRLFVNNDLTQNVHWQIDSSEGDVDSGETKIADLSGLVFDNLEVYLNADCCSIFTLNLGDISDKRLTEELLLGMLEEQVVDDIEDIKPILLRLADGLAHVAIFNRDFYTKLSDELQALNKPIKFIQSFAYSLEFIEGAWTLYLMDGQAFLRTSLYEYYTLDDLKPLPQLLEDMLSENKPSKILIYADNPDVLSVIHDKYDLECVVTDKYNFGNSVWNFYNPKSKKFKLKLESNVKQRLMRTLRGLKYFVAIIFIFWLINVLVMYGKQISLSHTISTQLNGVVPVNNIKNGVIDAANSKLDDLRHQKGLYNNQDMVALFSMFLNVVSDSNGMINGINYSSGKLDVLLNDQFDQKSFASNKAIFATKGIYAIISDYKTYKEANAKNNDSSSSMSNDDAVWVISLQQIGAQK